MSGLRFPVGEPLTLGVELELQILNRRDFDLVRGADDLLGLAARVPHPGDIKPEITASMIEVSTGVHRTHASLLTELRTIRSALTDMAGRLNLALAGGGAHPFQHWSERTIYDSPRFHHLSELYGYLAKQFTVFGQHVHVGCADGDEAMYLVNGLARFVPHFVALSASSPFYQGVDTAFDSARLNSIAAFPLSGRSPALSTWAAFEEHFAKLAQRGLVESMKDLYWDIRPKPEYGTVELRVCDTPLTVERAAALAAYVQVLARWLVRERPFAVHEDHFLTYGYNRFLACRFGLEAELTDPWSGRRLLLRDDVVETLNLIAGDARTLEAEAGLAELQTCLATGNDARWMREFAAGRSLADLMREQSRRWSTAAA